MLLLHVFAVRLVESGSDWLLAVSGVGPRLPRETRGRRVVAAFDVAVKRSVAVRVYASAPLTHRCSRGLEKTPDPSHSPNA